MQVDFNFVSLVLAVISICLSVFALWQANEHKKAAQKSEQAAAQALAEIRSESRAIREYAIPELKSYGEAMREFMFQTKVRDVEKSGVHQLGSTTTPAPSTTPTPTPAPSAATKRNLRQDVLAAIRDLTARDGKAQAMSLTDELKERYDFGVIVGELLMMRDEGIIRWRGDQDSPQAYAGVEIVGE